MSAVLRTAREVQTRMGDRMRAAVAHSLTLPDEIRTERRRSRSSLFVAEHSLSQHRDAAVAEARRHNADQNAFDAIEQIARALDTVDQARALADVGLPDRSPSPELQTVIAELADSAKTHHQSVGGYASITGVAYELYDMWGPYYEIVEAGAFTSTLDAVANGRSDLLYKIQHAGLGLAAPSAGTLRLLEDDQGLAFAALVDTRQTDAKDLISKLRTGSTSGQTSMAGMIRDYRWDDTYTVVTTSRWDLHRGDVASVAAGANPWGWAALGPDLAPPPPRANDDPFGDDAQRTSDPEPPDSVTVAPTRTPSQRRRRI